MSLPTQNPAHFWLLACAISLAAAGCHAPGKPGPEPETPRPEQVLDFATLYRQNCSACHGDNGKAEIDVVAHATDLTDPQAYRNGASDGEIFRSIRDGAGASMPSFKSEIDKEDDLWHLVNFIHSLWPPDVQPPLEKEKE